MPPLRLLGVKTMHNTYVVCMHVYIYIYIFYLFVHAYIMYIFWLPLGTVSELTLHGRSQVTHSHSTAKRTGQGDETEGSSQERYSAACHSLQTDIATHKAASSVTTKQGSTSAYTLNYVTA